MSLRPDEHRAALVCKGVNPVDVAVAADRAHQKRVEVLPKEYGLELVRKLRAVAHDGGSRRHFGLDGKALAAHLRTSCGDRGLTASSLVMDSQGVTYLRPIELIPCLVQAIQELSDQVQLLRGEKPEARASRYGVRRPVRLPEILPAAPSEGAHEEPVSAAAAASSGWEPAAAAEAEAVGVSAKEAACSDPLVEAAKARLEARRAARAAASK